MEKIKKWLKICLVTIIVSMIILLIVSIIPPYLGTSFLYSRENMRTTNMDYAVSEFLDAIPSIIGVICIILILVSFIVRFYLLLDREELNIKKIFRQWWKSNAILFLLLILISLFLSLSSTSSDGSYGFAGIVLVIFAQIIVSAITCIISLVFYFVKRKKQVQKNAND